MNVVRYNLLLSNTNPVPELQEESRAVRFLLLFLFLLRCVIFVIIVNLSSDVKMLT